MAERILSSVAPLDESWKGSLEDSGLGISSMADSEPDVRFVSKSMTPAANAPEDTDGADGERSVPQMDEVLLARVTQVVAQLRKRQHESKVCSLWLVRL